MNSESSTTESSGLALGDIYYVLFRHKFKILVCSCTGLALAFFAYKYSPRTFLSEAKLFIRYVTEGKSLTPAGSSSTAKSPDQRGETIMESETEIITSLDLARRVAEAIGPERILGPATTRQTDRVAASDFQHSDLDRAAAVIKKNVKVEVPSQSSVICLTFSHTNPGVAQEALGKLIEFYLQLHVEIHRSVGMAGEFLVQETNQYRSRLAQTEDELRTTLNNTGLISFEGSNKTHTELVASIRQQIFAAQAELAERSTILNQEQKRTADRSVTTSLVSPPAAVPPEQLNNYNSVVTRLSLLRKLEQELLTQFRPEHSRLKDIRAQLAAADVAKRAIEDRHPGVILQADASAAVRQAVEFASNKDVETSAARVVALEAKIKILKSQLDELRAETNVINQFEPKITELQRRKTLEEANYRHFSSSLEQARIDEALAAGQVTNINQIQTPSPPIPDQKNTIKVSALLGSGGILLGLGWAFLIELYLDRTIKRRTDVERLLQPPLFLSIPLLGRNGTRRLGGSLPQHHAYLASGNNHNGSSLGAFHETLRDRLIGYFEGKGLMKKPKLVGVTGLGAKVGVSTVATGLARSLSEIGEGSVLLVDLTLGRESARHFVHGEIECDLNQILDVPAPAHVAGNLYVVTDKIKGDAQSANVPQRFSKLAEKLKTSAFEYIVFDLPPISPISIASRATPFMDFVLMVVQSEKTEHRVFDRATSLLTQTNAPVGIVLNKTRSYVPSWLQQELIGES